MNWQPIATAPFDRDLELATIDATGSYALVFPCRRLLHGWVSARTRTSVNVHPTHWREWGASKVDAETRRFRSGIDRTLLLQHLSQAEHHAAEGRRHLARQEELIAELDRDGLDTAEALKVLATLRETQALHEQDVHRLLGELGKQPRNYDG
jgi:hypothetical protein